MAGVRNKLYHSFLYNLSYEIHTMTNQQSHPRHTALLISGLFVAVLFAAGALGVAACASSSTTTAPAAAPATPPAAATPPSTPPAATPTPAAATPPAAAPAPAGQAAAGG